MVSDGKPCLFKGHPFIKGPFMWDLECPGKGKEGQHKQKTQELQSAEINGGTWTGTNFLN